VLSRTSIGVIGKSQVFLGIGFSRGGVGIDSRDDPGLTGHANAEVHALAIITRASDSLVSYFTHIQQKLKS
jgi:hypothetical protein